MPRFIALFLILLSTGAMATVDDQTRLDKAYGLITVEPDSSILIANQVLQKAKSGNNRLLAGRSMVILGEAFRVKGELELSTNLTLQSIKILPETKEGKKSRAAAYGGLGNIFYMVGDLERSKNYSKKAFLLKMELGLDWEAAAVATQLVGIYSLTSQPDSALFMANYAEPILTKNRSYQPYLASLYNNLGAHYQMIGELDSAYKYYEKGIHINFGMGLFSQLPVGYFNMAEIVKLQKGPEEALQLLEVGFEFLQQFPNPEIEKAYYLMMSDCYTDLGDLKSSLLYRDKKDSVQNVISELQHQGKILELEAKYEDAERDRELTTKKVELQQNEIELSEQKQLNYLIILICTIVLALAFILFLHLTYKRRFDRELKEEKEKMFANVIHEIRTPLSLITGPLSEIRKHPDKLEQNYKIIDRNSKRLTDLVNQLLDVSRIDNLRFNKNYQTGILIDFLDQLVEGIDPLSAEKKIRINTTFVRCDRTIQFDFDALDKICSNLLTNAIKYSDRQSSIDFRVEVMNTELIIGVKDHGIGIDSKSLSTIFERFERANNADGFQGIGIGLALVKQLVEIYEGDIQVESEVGTGSLFKVSLPLISINEGEVVRENKSDSVILLLEDDMEMRKFIRGILEQEGYEVLEAENGKKGLEKLNDQLPDLIISDIMMPEMNGQEFALQVKSNDLFAHIPLIFLSARTATTVKLDGLSKGADLYLEKPFEPSELLLVVQNQLRTLKLVKERFNQQLEQEELSFEQRIGTTDAYLDRVNQRIIANLDNNDFSVENLADDLAISRSQLHRKIKSLTGHSISSYVRIIRLEKAMDLLKSNSGNVTEIAYQTGFNSQSYFSKSFTDHFGFPPSEIANRV